MEAQQALHRRDGYSPHGPELVQVQRRLVDILARAADGQLERGRPAGCGVLGR